MLLLNWLENLQREDQPPEYLWADDKGLELWFAAVREKQESGLPTRGTTDHAHTDQAPAMVENDHARALREAYR